MHRNAMTPGRHDHSIDRPGKRMESFMVILGNHGSLEELLPHQGVVGTAHAEEPEIAAGAWLSNKASIKFVNNHTKLQ
jgi:hypothetical protein